jgi:uncharacterized membrane-anchored protein
VNFLPVIIFAVVALLQLSVPASVIWKREQTLRHGRVWKFKTEPVDPVDAVRGRYIALRLAGDAIPAAQQSESEQFPADTTIYVLLKEDAEGFAEIERVSTTPMKGDNVIRTQAGSRWREKVRHINFPFDRLWVSEKVAPEAEKAYLENSRRDKENTYVTVRVREGDAALEQLFIGGESLADYLRNHSAR